MLEIKDYIRDRVDDQITWYDKKSQTAQKHYKRIQIIEIIASAAIPIIVPYAQSGNAISILVAILGALIAILEAVCRLYKYHENWIQYRTTAELLKYLILETAAKRHYLTPKIIRNIRKTLILKAF